MLPSCFSLLSEGVTYSSRWPKGLAFSRGGKGGGVRGKENIGFCNSCLCSFYDSFLLSYYSLCLWLIAFFLCFRWCENLLWFNAWISQKLKKKYRGWRGEQGLLARVFLLLRVPTALLHSYISRFIIHTQ